MLTRSGLLFLAAAFENVIRAYDVTSGEELWHDPLKGLGHSSMTLATIKTSSCVAPQVTDEQARRQAASSSGTT